MMALAAVVAAAAITTPAPQYDRPARPIVESLGDRLRAVQGTTCWRTTNPDGTGEAGAGTPRPNPAHGAG